jgi:hypothetical protein
MKLAADCSRTADHAAPSTTCRSADHEANVRSSNPRNGEPPVTPPPRPPRRRCPSGPRSRARRHAAALLHRRGVRRVRVVIRTSAVVRAAPTRPDVAPRRPGVDRARAPGPALGAHESLLKWTELLALAPSGAVVMCSRRTTRWRTWRAVGGDAHSSAACAATSWTAGAATRRASWRSASRVVPLLHAAHVVGRWAADAYGAPIEIDGRDDPHGRLRAGRSRRGDHRPAAIVETVVSARRRCSAPRTGAHGHPGRRRPSERTCGMASSDAPASPVAQSGAPTSAARDARAGTRARGAYARGVRAHAVCGRVPPARSPACRRPTSPRQPRRARRAARRRHAAAVLARRAVPAWFADAKLAVHQLGPTPSRAGPR